MERGYTCNRFPFLQIGSAVKFEGGLFVTEDPALQQLIESNEWYKVLIHPREVRSHHAPKPVESEVSEEPTPSAGVVSGLRGTRRER
jgi:hypothetical protein